MPSSNTYIVLLVLLASAALVLCRPQSTADSSTFELGPSPQFGTFIGEIVVHSANVAVDRPRKKSAEKENNGPRAFRLVGDSDGESRVGSSLGSEVALASGAGLSISGSTITFNKPAEVVPIPAK